VTDADTLFAEHRLGVFRYLRRIIGQAEAARDLTQEVFLRVTRTQAPEADASGRRAWVFTIARNLALNHLRDHQRRPALVELTEPVSRATQEIGAAIEQALSTLHEMDRDVFLMRETAGLSYDEIASVCGISVEAVRGRLRRARQRLREALGGLLERERLQGVQMTRRDDHERR
jgi:RNA polymerase sigma-70 factor (ECF subfamily)